MLRIVAYVIEYSPGNPHVEYYTIGLDEDADKVGQVLVDYFNGTGGNNDGSLRSFQETLLDFKVINFTEYDKNPIINDKGNKVHALSISKIPDHIMRMVRRYES